MIFNQGGTADPPTQELKFAQQALGRNDLLPFFHMPAAAGSLPWNSVSATGRMDWVSGALSYSTGATSGNFSREVILADSGGVFGRFLRTGASWYISSRIAITTAISAQTTAFTGGETNAGAFALAMGVVGSVSTTNYVLKGSAGSSLNSGVAIDTNFHTHRAWRAGSTTFYQVDTTLVTGTADIAADVMPYLFVGNGTDNVNRAMSVIWWSAYAPSL